MANVKIRIESQSEEQAQAEQAGGATTQTQKLAVASIFAQQAINFTKQVVNIGISNIANFSGNYVKQDQVQQAVSFLSEVAGVGTAFAVNPVAGFVALGGLALKYTSQAIKENREMTRAEYQTDYLRRISGNSTTNGSRTR